MGYLMKFFEYTAAIISVCALAGVALVAVYLPVYYGFLGFPFALGIWASTIIAAAHVLRWGFG